MSTYKPSKILTCLGALLIIACTRPAFCQPAAPAPDPALLSKFELLCKQVGNTDGNYTLGGVINITDPSNPKANLNHIGFLFCKQGDEFYYRLGQTETVNEQDVSLYIDHPAKRILVSPKKKVVYDIGLQQFGEMGKHIRDEQYQLQSKITGDEQTLMLVNEHHISCKQYAIVFNRQTLKIKRLYLRLTDFNNPLRADRDKIVDVSITTWEHVANLAQYLTKNKVIKNVNGVWGTVGAYKGYRLIKI